MGKKWDHDNLTTDSNKAFWDYAAKNITEWPEGQGAFVVTRNKRAKMGHFVISARSLSGGIWKVCTRAKWEQLRSQMT